MNKLLAGLGIGILFAVAPSSTNYTLKSYDIGSGGIGSSSSTNFGLNGISGEQSLALQTSTNYSTVLGANATINSNEPPAPTFTNPSNYYDRLKVVINTASNPTDTRYLIAISSNSFVTTQYIQSDNSVGNSQALVNYQTYAAWGGASGFLVLGLNPSTTYQIKVKAFQGKFSGSPFGPTATAATIAPNVSVSLTTTLNATPPFPVTFSSLTAGTVVSGSADAIVTFTSNANNGGTVYTKSANAGLLSTLVSNTIPSASADLTAATSGYGAQVTSVSQTSGGPISSVSPFNGVANNVGGLTTTLQSILSTSSPILNGSGTIRLKAKATTITPSASDYSDVVTLVTAMNF